MKKLSIIAAAVAAITTGTAIADTTVYGRSRMGLVVAQGADKVGVANASSRLGFKGAEDLGGGLSATYHYEFGYQADNAAQGGLSNRIGTVGLKGDFGTFTMGNQWVPTYVLATGGFDPFNQYGSDDGYQLGSRAGDSVAYVTKVGSATLGVAFVALDQVSTDLVDGTNVAVSIPMGDITIGLGMHDNTNDSGMVVSAMYKGDGFTAGAMMNNAADIGGDDIMTFLVTANMGGGKVLARFSSLDNADVTGTTLGYHHNLSKRTQVYVENSSEDFNDSTVVGLKHNF